MKPYLILLLSVLHPPVQADSPVWLVESGSSRLFLAGTVHILRDSDYPLPAAFDAAYAQAQTLAFEIDIAQTQSVAFQQQMMKAITLPANTRLDKILKPDTLKKLSAYLDENGLDLEHFMSLKPSMVATTLTMMELTKMGVSSKGVDHHFYLRARRDEKKILSLESAQQQIDFLTNMGNGLEDLMILRTLQELENLPSEFSDMLISWRQGDNNRLEALFIEPMRKDFEPVYRQLLVNRNLNWLATLRHYLQTPETEMVLVGSAHLPGDDGLLQLLRNAGHRVTQLD